MKSFLLFSLLFLLFSCGSEAESIAVPKGNAAANGTVDAEIKAIDQELSASSQIASSLLYTMENGSTMVVRAHLNGKGKLLKIEEEYNEGNGASPGKRLFYLQDEKLLASIERYEDNSKADQPQFVEQLSYYDKKGNVIKSLEKRVTYEEDLEGVEFTEVAKRKVDMSRAQRALNQEGEFETTFQGFVNAQALRYLVVGSSQPNGYTSAVRINNEDDFIRFISQNEKKYLNRKVKISFEHVTDPTGFQYQSYIQGSFSE